MQKQKRMPAGKPGFLRWASLIVLSGIVACTRNTIEFGTTPENNYTHLAYTDTISVKLSTVLADSFATGGATSFLLGKYKDPYLGIVKANSFFQLDKPAEIRDMPDDASFDSLTFIIKPNKYYYGDTSRQQTIYVNELNRAITLSDANSLLYNTSNFEVKAAPLGAKTLHIHPSGDDSISIRLSDTKGSELFTKLKEQSADVTNSDNFQNYFKGISLTTGVNDTTGIFGLAGGAGSSMVMRLSYHTSIPYPESHYIDFPLLVNEYSFNQILADRSGTGIVSAGNISGVTEISFLQTNGYVFSQPGTGLNLKMTFPTLKSILSTDNYVKLMKAELIVRPAYLSFDKDKFKLPDRLHLAYTDGSNNIGSEIPDSTGAAIMYANPVIDDIYGENNYYRFNVTSFISQLLAISGSEDAGLYLMQDFSATSPQISRLVMGASSHNYITRLQLTVLVVNK